MSDRATLIVLVAQLAVAGSVGAELPGPRPEIVELAERAATCAVSKGIAKASAPLTIIDYSLPSTRPRLWILDPPRQTVLWRELVSHGKGSGNELAKAFSNQPGSLQSSLGLFVTEEAYTGRNGYSLRLRGLEPGVNDRARERAIVIHGADYVSKKFINQYGRLGRSWGCPAVPSSVAHRIIDAIKDGSLVFVYYPDEKWLGMSRFLNACRADERFQPEEAQGAPGELIFRKSIDRVGRRQVLEDESVQR